MDENQQQTSARVNLALQCLRDLDRDIEVMALEYGLGEIDAWPENESILYPRIGSDEVTDEIVRATARDSLRLAHLSTVAAIVEIEESGDASNAIAHTIKAGRIYGLTRSMMLSWRAGVRPLMDTLALLKNEREVRDRNLSDGRAKGGAKVKQTSAENKLRAYQLAREAFKNEHFKEFGKSIAYNLDARAEWIRKNLEAEGCRQVNGNPYKHRTIRTWITGIKSAE